MDKVFLHEKAICESPHIGAGTRIWAFTHVLPKARIGQDCNLCEHVFIENDVILGDRVTLKSGVYLWDGIRIEDDVFIGPNATFTNDKYPRSKHTREPLPPIIIEACASIGANATILPGIRIGHHAMVGAGAVVTHDVPAYAIVTGNPARIKGYMPAPATPDETQRPAAGVSGVVLRKLPVFTDMRGSLSVGHFQNEIPFVPHRYFVVFDVPSREVRGQHAHKTCQQFLVCLHGSVKITVTDTRHSETFVLNTPHLGLYLPAGIWATQEEFSDQATMLVFASHPYDPSDYIRSYDAFIQFTQERHKALP